MNAKASTSIYRRIFSISFVLLLVFVWMAGPATMQRFQADMGSYIVQGTTAEKAAELVQSFGGQVTSYLDVIHGVGALLPSGAVTALRTQPGITAVTANSSVEATDIGTNCGNTLPETDYPEVVGADVAWMNWAIGYNVTVAVVDTGFESYNGLKKNIWGNSYHRILGWIDFVRHTHNPTDPNGHGTHVAGIIANTDIGPDGHWNGVAPGVSLVGVRVLDDQGQGNYERVIQGIQWVIAHKQQYNIKVMNLSLVSPVQSPYWADPLNQAVMQAWAAGITVVVAAGNGGPGPMSIGVPGNNPYVITVGAFTDNFTPDDWSDDYIAPFSAAGPTLDAFVKPDVVAPGAHMISTMGNNTVMATSHSANRVGRNYFSTSGTSQAAAVVSGIAALVLSGHPALTPDQVKFRLMVTAFPWIDLETDTALYSMWQQGTGRVNAPDAVMAQNITASANAGMNIAADIAGTSHYQGYSYYDDTTGTFRLVGDYGTWAGGYGTWAGDYGTWAGDYGTWAGDYGTWAGDYGTWAGDYGTWAGGYGTWAGGYGTWAGGYGTWAGGYGTWAGGYGTWAGGYGTWAGSLPWIDTIYADPVYASNFANGVVPDATTSTTSINDWVDEP